MLHPFTNCIGYELISPLHKMALKNKVDYDKKFKKIIQENPSLFHNHFTKTDIIVPNLKPIQADFFNQDWSDASVVFTNSTCFTKSILDEIFEKSLSLPKGAILINTSHKMPKKLIDKWQCITPFKRLMSWGVGKIFIYRKR
jgi:hypothetical protein